MPRYSAFLSYSRKDLDLVEPFREACELHGLRVWFDKSELSGGDLWELQIRRALTQSNCLVVFVTKNVMRGYAAKEIAIAREMRKPIIPVALDDTIYTDEPSLSVLRESHFLDARSDSSTVASALPKEIAKRETAPVVAIYNVKGGVGKTTLTMNVGMYFYKQRKKRVLLIDLDAQTNLSTALILPSVERVGGGPFGFGSSVRRRDVFKGLLDTKKSARFLLLEARKVASDPTNDFELNSYIHTIERSPGGGSRLDIVPGDPELHLFATADTKETLVAQKGFMRFVEQCRTEYDVIMIDLGPSVNHLTKCALASATHVLSPVTPSAFAMQGLNLLDDITVRDDAASAGREHLIVINAIRTEGKEQIRASLMRSKYASDVLASELCSSNHFFNRSKEEDANASLNFLPAYGTWSANPNAARLSLQNVASEIAERVGLHL
ncbi:MAG: AAA family ATPase [Hyphomonadaceae bacterium]